MKTPPPRPGRSHDTPPAHGPDVPDPAPPGTCASPVFPDLASLAALRAWYEGLTARAAVSRYLPHQRADGQSSRALISRIRRTLVAFAHARQRDDLAQLIGHGAAGRTRRAAAVVHAIDILRNMPMPEPRLTDDVALWLAPRAVSALHAQRIRTLAELTLRVPRRHRWWRVIPGLGQTGARTIEAFFAAHPRLTARARQLVDAIQPVQDEQEALVVPWEHLVLPEDLDGSRGRFRAPRDACLLSAGNDYEALQSWLSLHESADTHRAYRKEAERLILWAIAERQQPLSSLTTDDAIAYRAFLRRPAPRGRWTGPPCSRRSAGWRPFAHGLSARSAAYALSVLRALFRWLIEQCYVLANPFAGIRVRGASTHGPFDTARSLADNEWRTVRALADGLETSYGWSAPAAQRLRFLLDFSYATGLRAHELVSATLGDIGTDARDDPWLQVTGKGAQSGKVALPPLARDALESYLMQRGLPVSRRRWRPDIPLVPTLGPAGDGPGSRQTGMTATRLRQVLQRFFIQAAALVQDDSPALAAKLRRASPHWMRHTHASHALEHGVELVAVRDNLRHASIATTSTYLHGDDARRARQVGAAFARIAPGNGEMAPRP
ncbi:phage integrase family protein [Paraburkholderia madseniana]|uniref:phage integrase family protein n=1 Tax=Paraburkholderia madseniana TaxID=2599607 RepID=UPI0038BABE77